MASVSVCYITSRTNEGETLGLRSSPFTPPSLKQVGLECYHLLDIIIKGWVYTQGLPIKGGGPWFPRYILTYDSP